MRLNVCNILFLNFINYYLDPIIGLKFIIIFFFAISINYLNINWLLDENWKFYF